MYVLMLPQWHLAHVLMITNWRINVLLQISFSSSEGRTNALHIDISGFKLKLSEEVRARRGPFLR